jgi:hypothetical protein
MSEEPNLDFGTPTIFFDSHPEEQESYLYSYWSSLKSTLHIAFTGIVPKYHGPGTLRIIWYTHDGNQGMKDYGLHEYVQVRDNFDVLLALDEVRRVVIMGYSGQNPYVLHADGRGIGDKYKDEKKRGLEGKEREKKQKERFDNSEEGRKGKIVDIESVIEKHDKAQEERRREAEERIWKENEGLLSGGMV